MSPRKKKPKPPVPAGVRQALLDLAARLGADEAEVATAIDDPAGYVERYEDRADERDIEDPDEVEPWLALTDALEANGKVIRIDWKADIDTVQAFADRLIPTGSLGDAAWAWFLDDRYDKTKTHELLEIAGAFLTHHGFALLTLDTDGDEYVLVVRAASEVADLQALAVQAGQQILVWTGPLPPEALLPPPEGPRVERFRFADLHYGLCGPPHGGVVCIGTGRHGSDWLDLRTWPPRQHRWAQSWLIWAHGGGPGGSWLVTGYPGGPDERGDVQVFVVDDPFVPYEQATSRVLPFGGDPGPDPVDQAHFVAGRIVAFPWSASSSRDTLLVEKVGQLVPADAPRAVRTSLGSGVTGIGQPYIVWAGRAWKWEGDTFTPFGREFQAAKEVPTVPAEGDTFYALAGATVIRVGGARNEHPLGDAKFTDIGPGPCGSVLLTVNPYDRKPALAWVWFPQHDMVIRIERKLLGIRDSAWIAWSEPADRILVCQGDVIWAVPTDVLRTLPQIRASTRRKLKAPIAF